MFFPSLSIPALLYTVNVVCDNKTLLTKTAVQFARNSWLSVQQKMMKKQRRRVEERGFIEREMCIGKNKRRGNRWDYMHNKMVIHFFWDRHVHSEYGYGICTYTRYFCKGRVKLVPAQMPVTQQGPTPSKGGAPVPAAAAVTHHSKAGPLVVCCDSHSCKAQVCGNRSLRKRQQHGTDKMEDSSSINSLIAD